MAFPAGNGLLAARLLEACNQAQSLKQFLQQLNTDSSNGDVSRDRLVLTLVLLARAIAAWNTASGSPGMAVYAQAQFGGVVDDIAAEFTAMVNATGALQTWVFNNFPKDAGSGAWLVESYDLAGIRTPLVFTAAQLSQFRTNAAAVIATIS